MGTIKGCMPSEAQWSEFLDRLSPAYALASTKEVDYNKICLVVGQLDKIAGPMYVLYCMDISSGCMVNDCPIKSLQPTLAFAGDHGKFSHNSYVVVGSKLFMFGGHDIEEEVWSGSWSYYDFSSLLYSDTTKYVVEEDLEFGPPMKGSKYEAIAAVVGGNKICVFATLLYDKDQAETVYPPNFEVLNTVGSDWSWTELHEPVDNYSERGLDQIYIRSYSIDGPCLVICTDIGIYGINIEAKNPEWVKMEGSGRIEGGPFSGRWAVVGKNICSPLEVMRFGEVKSCPFAFKSTVPRRVISGGLLSERLQNGFNLFSVEGAYVSGPRDPALFVNITKLDSELLENMRDKLVLEDIPTVKSFIYAATGSQNSRCIELIGIFLIKETEQERSKKRRRSDLLEKEH